MYLVKEGAVEERHAEVFEPRSNQHVVGLVVGSATTYVTIEYNSTNKRHAEHHTAAKQ